MVYTVKEESGRLLLNRVKIADNFWLKLIGLMGKKALPEGEGLFLKKVKSVHTCFMRFPIDVIYLDRGYRVIAKETLPPWRCGKIYRKAAHVLEIGSCGGDRFDIDMKLELTGCNQEGGPL